MNSIVVYSNEHAFHNRNSYAVSLPSCSPRHIPPPRSNRSHLNINFRLVHLCSYIFSFFSICVCIYIISICGVSEVWLAYPPDLQRRKLAGPRNALQIHVAGALIVQIEEREAHNRPCVDK